MRGRRRRLRAFINRFPSGLGPRRGRHPGLQPRALRRARRTVGGWRRTTGYSNGVTAEGHRSWFFSCKGRKASQGSSSTSEGTAYGVATSNFPAAAVGGARAVAMRCSPETGRLPRDPRRPIVHPVLTYGPETGPGYGAQTSSRSYPRSVRRSQSGMPDNWSADRG